MEKPIKFKNILAGGCSFSQNGIGGEPPTLTSAGANSFRYDIDYGKAEPVSWTSFLAHSMNPDSFTNVAVSGQGLIATSKTICDMLDRFNYQPSDTLVIFNISELSRLDIQCNFIDGTRFVPWTSDMLDYSFLQPHTTEWKKHFVETNLEKIQEQNLNSLSILFKYLKYNKYPFVFTLLDNITDISLIQKYKSHLVPLKQHGIYEYCRSINAISEDHFHPTTQGYHAVGKFAHNFIQQKYKLGT